MISVILPVYNAELYVDDAVSSILSQTFKDFELICIDDGSTDGSYDILKKHADSDSRVKLITRENRGLIYSLNEALSFAKYDHIARMDADDISECNRLEIQYEYLRLNPSIGVVGSECTIIDENGGILRYTKSSKSKFITKSLLVFGSTIAHPTVMFNKKITGNIRYSELYPSAEDYELWLRLSKRCSLVVINSRLLKYRVLPTSISRSRRHEQLKSMAKASEFHIFNDLSDSCHLVNYYSTKKISKGFLMTLIFKQKNKLMLPIQMLYVLRSLLKDKCGVK